MSFQVRDRVTPVNDRSDAVAHLKGHFAAGRAEPDILCGKTSHAAAGKSAVWS